MISSTSTGDSGKGRGRRGGGGRGRGRGGRGGRGSNNKNRGAASKAPTETSTQSRKKNTKGGRGDGRDNKSQKGKKEGMKPASGVAEEELKRQEEARKQEEAEKAALKRQEEAEKATKAALEARQKEKEDLEQKIRDAGDLLKGAVDTTLQHKEYRAAMEPEALAASRKEFEANKKKLKTDLKKCTAFVKKIRTGTAWSMKPEDITKDVATLNLSRYVEEVVTATLETKPKVADIPVIVALTVAMHLRYPEFLSNLLPLLWNVVNGKADAETAKLRRVYLRLLTEFLLAGLLPETKTLVKCIAEATGGKDGSYAVQDAILVVAFSKAAGFEIFGVTPRSVGTAVADIERESERAQASSPSDEARSEEAPILVSQDILDKAMEVRSKIDGVLNERAVSSELSETFLKHSLGAYKTLADSLVLTHGKLQKLEKRCEQDRLLSGTLTEAREKGLIDARKLKESLEKSVEALSDVLDQPMPHLQETEVDADDEGGTGLEVWTKGGGEGEDDFGPFDDEETRAFYCDVPDLLTTTPPALLGMTLEAIEARKAENLKKYGAQTDSEVEESESPADIAPTSEAELDAEDEELAILGAGDEEKEESGMDEESEVNKDTPHYKLMVLLEQELPECNRREQIDEVTEKFCTNHGSTKNSRKRLTRTLFLVPRNRLDLLPFYSRMAATLDRVWPDIAAPLVTDLEQQFHGQAKFKKNQNIESRMKSARYIGELTKFRVAPPIVFLRCMKRCLDDFTGSNVDVACCLLESAGRFLYRTKHTSARVTTLMDSMTRLSKAKNLDERSQSLIKASFYSVKPPPSGPRKQSKEYPPLEAYLRYLLLVRLEPTEAAVSFVTKQLTRLPWSDPSKYCGSVVCRIMLKACRKGRYKAIEAIAAVASSLRSQRYANEVPARLIDAVLEELHWAIDYPNFRDQQRTITYARLLGELYCLSLVPGHIIFQQLYDFINLGHEIPEALREASRRLPQTQDDAAFSTEKLPVFNSASGISQTIQEDEAMEESELDTAREEKTSPGQQPVAVSMYSKYDPRVPSPNDPPNAAYRIKLVCTVLEVVAKSIVSRNNLPRLKGFLCAFQRYLFTKTMLPSEVEFSILDTFDVMDSQWRRLMRNAAAQTANKNENKDAGFPRYSTWLDAHNATLAIEESEARQEEQKGSHLDTLAVDWKSIRDMEGDGHSLNDDSTSMLDEDDDSLSAAMSEKDSATEGDGHNEDEMDTDADGAGEDVSDNSDMSEGEDEDESDFEAGTDAEDEEFDEEAYMRQLEEEAFERELRRITKEALDKGKNASRKLVADYMPSGSQIVRRKPADPSKAMDSSAGEPSPFGFEGPGISFQLLKKGHKGRVEAKELLVPADTNLAKVAGKQDDAAAREMDVIKQRVLQYEAESAEAEYAGGNVYLEQERLQVIRNRPLSMEDIDRNFGTTGGNLRPSDKAKSNHSASTREGPPLRGRGAPAGGPRGGSGRGYGRGRGRGRSSSSGRTLYG